MDIVWLWNSILTVLNTLKPQNNNEIKRWLFIISLFIVGGFTWYNYNKIGSDEIRLQLEQSVKVESMCEHIGRKYDATNVSIFTVHNGKIALNRLHLLRFSYLTGWDENYNMGFVLNNALHDRPVYPYAKYFLKMMTTGYYKVEEIETYPDPLIRDLKTVINKKSFINLPLHENKDLYGFVAIGFQEKHLFTTQEINDLIREVELLNAEINSYK